MGKLLFFASDFKIGLSSLLTDQLIAFTRNHIDVFAVAGENEQETGLANKLSNEGISVCRINGLDKHENIFSLSKKIKNVIEENSIEYVHVQNNWQLAIIILVKYFLLRNLNLKIIYTLHGFRHNSPIKSVIAQFVIGFALLLFSDRVICMSQYLVTKFRFLKYKISLIPLGVNDDFFEDDSYKLPEKGLQMIFPAQFRYGKNQDLIIRAFAKFIKRTGDVDSHLILPGTGELLEEYKTLTKKLKIDNRVSFPGFCSKSDIKKMYLMSNIGIVASNCETFGQSIVEPYVLGRCVISTHVGIADDILVDGENGYFFGTEDELTSVFEKLKLNPSLIIKAGKINYNDRKTFSWKDVSVRYQKMLEVL